MLSKKIGDDLNILNAFRDTLKIMSDHGLDLGVNWENIFLNNLEKERTENGKKDFTI